MRDLLEFVVQNRVNGWVKLKKKWKKRGGSLNHVTTWIKLMQLYDPSPPPSENWRGLLTLTMPYDRMVIEKWPFGQFLTHFHSKMVAFILVFAPFRGNLFKPINRWTKYKKIIIKLHCNLFPTIHPKERNNHIFIDYLLICSLRRIIFAFGVLPKSLV